MNMDRKKLLIALIMAAALIAAGAGGYTAGRNTASAQYMSGYEAGRQEASDRYKSGYDTGRKEADAEYKKERDLNILLHRSDLEGLKNVEGPIYVTGHKSPDTDTVGSSIGFAELLRQLGYDAHPVVLGKINPETQYVLEAADLEAPELLKDASGRNMVLVDHSEVMQSADGLSGANIVAIIETARKTPVDHSRLRDTSALQPRQRCLFLLYLPVFSYLRLCSSVCWESMYFVTKTI